ncbi:MAG: RNA polymerase sigma factor [Myxococcota bacterium]
MTEQELIQGLIDKNPAALQELYDEYRNRIFAVVRPLVKDKWDAEEVTQDVVWTVHRKIDTFRGDSALWSWMYRIAVNASRMKTRKYKRHPVPMDDEILTAMRNEEDEGDFDRRPDEYLASKEVVGEIKDFLAECNYKNKTVFMDMEVEGKDKEEVAEKLNLSVPAVKTRLHRIRVSLRERLEKNYLEASPSV